MESSRLFPRDGRLCCRILNSFAEVIGKNMCCDLLPLPLDRVVGEEVVAAPGDPEADDREAIICGVNLYNRDPRLSQNSSMLSVSPPRSCFFLEVDDEEEAEVELLLRVFGEYSSARILRRRSSCCTLSNTERSTWRCISRTHLSSTTCRAARVVTSRWCLAIPIAAFLRPAATTHSLSNESLSWPLGAVLLVPIGWFLLEAPPLDALGLGAAVTRCRLEVSSMCLRLPLGSLGQFACLRRSALSDSSLTYFFSAQYSWLRAFSVTMTLEGSNDRRRPRCRTVVVLGAALVLLLFVLVFQPAELFVEAPLLAGRAETIVG